MTAISIFLALAIFPFSVFCQLGPLAPENSNSSDMNPLGSPRNLTFNPVLQAANLRSESISSDLSYQAGNAYNLPSNPLVNHLGTPSNSTINPVMQAANLSSESISSDLNYQAQKAYNLPSNPLVHAVSFNNDPVFVLPNNKITIVDETSEFLDKTRSNIASGICYFEVPTSSLPRNPNTALPRGNGSDPTMSRIQVCCEGYKPNENNSLLCDPICRKNCPNGICTAPNKCVCLPGYVRDHLKNCVPACPVACSNGFCQPDGSCVCQPGFVLDQATRKFCKPYCSNGCIENAWCSAPEICKCYRNYKLSANGTCLPSCENCQNGNCTAPGVCMCNQGYQRVGNDCKPICSKGCINAKCTAPETCSCIPGFLFDISQGKCMPHCDKTCTNGFCSGGVCTCNPGYNYDRLTRTCKPICTNGCIANAKCAAPETCKCKSQYELTLAGTCLPKCRGCTHGDCTAPGVCACHRGYKLKSNVCQPDCRLHGCTNGTCIAPGTCSCSQGFVLDTSRTSCLRQFQEQCQCSNGFCNGNNFCTSCKPGFELDPKHRHACKPHCSGGCRHGVCTLPNFCICNAGYTKRRVSGKQTCVRV